jgi:DNA repair protein RadC
MTVQRVREMELRFKSFRLPLPVQREVLSSREAAEIAQALLGDSPLERAIALHLDTRRRLIGFHIVSMGTIDSTIVEPRAVLLAALMSGARSIVVAHNHPSGDPTPSREDLEITRRLAAAGDLMGVPLDDSLVTGEEGRYFSFREAGVL